MVLEDQQRGEHIEGEQRDMLKQLASSSPEYSADALKVMNQPRQHNPEVFNLLDAHNHT